MSKPLSRRSRDFFAGIPHIYSASPGSEQIKGVKQIKGVRYLFPLVYRATSNLTPAVPLDSAKDASSK